MWVVLALPPLLLLALASRADALTPTGGDHGNDSAGGGGPPWWWCNGTAPGEEERASGGRGAAAFSCGGGWCVAERALCNGVPDCPAGEDESVHHCGCLPNEFRCSNSCIDLVRRCDREPNCPDQEDETGCESFVCPVTHFKCANHYCVPEDAVCNFEDDCGDGSDEQNCSHRTCWNSEFRCDNGECIRPGYVCDGAVDCRDASDEAHCSPDFFRECGDGSRVHQFFWCDDWTHCADNHADELNCTACDGADEFRCPNGRCIRRANLCDSYCDCVPTGRGQGCADEAGCQPPASYLHSHGVSVCTPGKTLLCTPHPGSREDRCIAPQFICDGHNDCHNGNYVSDELGCQSSAALLTGQWFRCSEGRMVPQETRCDFKWDCLLGEDEQGCERVPCSQHEFACSNGQCIPIESRCDLKFDCWDKSDEFNCKEAPCPAGQLRCAGSGQCVPAAWWCDFYLDCPDGSDELSCAGRGRDCGPGEFRCQSGQCVARHHVCFKSGHERSGCADGSHLLHCENVTCPENTFKCRNGPCLNMSLRCNAVLDCKDTWVDEDGCTFQCSTEPRCVCHDTKINCTSLELKEFPADIEFQINRFYMANNFLNETLNEDSFSKLDRLVYLDLRNNSISRLPAMIFRNLWRLHILNLQDNRISIINNGSFFGLPDLRTLHLQGNGIEVLESMAFYGLSSITTLDLKHQRIRNISRNAFVGLRSLVALDLSFNHIFHLADGSLNGMPKLETLDLSNNFIKYIGNNVFRSVTALKTLVTDEFRFCCVARHAARCLPAPDEFSSCEDLMSNLVLRVCVWVLGVVATAGNALVIAWRMRFKHSNQVHSFLITNLAIGDLFMGSYLLIIAAADAHYRGVYSVHDRDWRSSALCNLAGFISTFSSEFSVYTLTVITLDRFLVIIFPFRIRRLEMSKTRVLMAAGWAVAAFLSGLPLFRIDYFRNFYGRSGVCLALHITPDKPSGWEYSVFVFLFLNLASFSVIALGYVWMYAVARTTQRAARQQHRRPDSATMARRMTLIVATDAACWMPIILLGLLSLAGITVPPQVFAWVAVFVLPLNAAVNPVLYTISTAPFLTPARRGLRAFKRSWKLSLTADQRRTFSSSLGSTHLHNCNLCDVNCPLDVNIFMENGGGVATSAEHNETAGGDGNNEPQHLALFALTRRQPQAAHDHRWCSRAAPQQRHGGDWRGGGSGRWRHQHQQPALAAAAVDTAVSARGEVIPLRQVAAAAPAPAAAPADSRRRRLRELYD